MARTESSRWRSRAYRSTSGATATSSAVIWTRRRRRKPPCSPHSGRCAPRREPRSMSLTRADLENGLLRATFRRFNPEVRVLSDAEQEASLREVLDRHEPGADVWLFGYGSLVWNPLVHYEERRVARLHGFHRSFCLWSPVNPRPLPRSRLVIGLASGGRSCITTRRASGGGVSWRAWLLEFPSTRRLSGTLSLAACEGSKLGQNRSHRRRPYVPGAFARASCGRGARGADGRGRGARLARHHRQRARLDPP